MLKFLSGPQTTGPSHSVVHESGDVEIILIVLLPPSWSVGIFRHFAPVTGVAAVSSWALPFDALAQANELRLPLSSQYLEA